MSVRRGERREAMARPCSPSRSARMGQTRPAQVKSSVGAGPTAAGRSQRRLPTSARSSSAWSTRSPRTIGPVAPSSQPGAGRRPALRQTAKPAPTPVGAGNAEPPEGRRTAAARPTPASAAPGHSRRWPAIRSFPTARPAAGRRCSPSRCIRDEVRSPARRPPSPGDRRPPTGPATTPPASGRSPSPRSATGSSTTRRPRSCPAAARPDGDRPASTATSIGRPRRGRANRGRAIGRPAADWRC